MELERMDAFFERRIDGYDSHMLQEIGGAGEFYPFTAGLLPKGPCRVLDLGCGTGLELEEFFKVNPAAAVTGVDLSEGMLAELKRKFPERDLELIKGSYFEVPLGEERFDGAVSVESLHHFTPEEKLGLYRRLLGALKPGGCFILTDYFAESPELEKEYFQELDRMKREQGLPEGFYHYDTPLLVEHEIQVLKDAGFGTVEVLGEWGNTRTLRAVKEKQSDERPNDMTTAICPGSFDPVTLGHLDIISRASKIFDRIIVAVPVNPDKRYSFTVEERMEMLRTACEAQGLQNVEVDRVEGLLADYARERGAVVVIKGLRALTDFEYEFQQALTNKKLNPQLETMFLSTSAEHMFLSSSMVKQVAGFGGDISHFVPECILGTIRDRLCLGRKQ